MKAPTVSIIIPVFNKCELTLQCLRSMLALPSPVPYEVIVVDNGSTDGTAQQLKEFGGRVRLLRRETNGGFAVACNQGAAAAQSDLLLFLNNDTIPLAGWLEPLVADVRKHAEVAAVGSKLLFQNGLVQHAGVAFTRETRSPFHPHLLLRADDPRVNRRRELQALTGACLLVRKSWFERCGRFNEAYLNGYEDLELCLELRRHKGVLVYQPKSVLYHLESQTPGRKQHDNQNRALFFQRWSELLLSDEDAYYFADDYRLLERKSDWPLDCRLARIGSDTERRQWAMVANTQLAAAQGEWAHLTQLLSDTEAWPQDARLRRWAGVVANRLRIPGAAQRHLQRALELEEHPEVRLHLNPTTPPTAAKGGAPAWSSLLFVANAQARAHDFNGAGKIFQCALMQGAPAEWALTGWLETARQGGRAQEAEQLEQALRSLPRVPGGVEPQLRPNTMSPEAAVSATPGGKAEQLTSILLLVHNQLEHTRRCLASLEQHTPQRHELILVDNASTDGTAEWLTQYAASHPHVKLIRNATNRGFAAGNNQALALAQGNFILLLNNDTVVTPGWLDHMLAVFQQHPATGFVGPRSNRVVGPQLVEQPGYSTLEELPAFAAQWARQHAGQSRRTPRVIGFCLLARRAAIEALGGLDEQFGSGNFEDDDYCLRAGFAGFEVRIADASFVHHVGGQTFQAARIDYRQAMLTNWALFKKKWHMPAEAPIEKGYSLPVALPPGLSLKVPVPDLARTHEASGDTRCWTDRQLARKAAQPAKASGASKPIALPPCALIGHLAKARELFARRQHAEAWAAARAAIALRPFHPEAYLLLAEVARAAGDGASARRCAQHARDLAPDWKPAKKFLNGKLSGTAKPAWLVLPEALAASNAPRSTLHAPRLSVCLITKNEERFLAQCLTSVRGLADQIVVVDTGSTDRTVDIAKEHGAEVHHFAWCDDFSAARNVALEHATGDWILMLDADEELPAASHEPLRRLLGNAAVMAWRLPIIDVGREDEGCSYVPRLFRNAPALFYVGRVHEQVFSSIEVRRQEWGLDNRLGDAPLRHHGYQPQVVKDRNKVERNLRLLEKAIQEMPGEPSLLMNYGLELTRSGQAQAGLEQYRQAFAFMAAQPAAQVVPETCEMLLTQFCTQLMAHKCFGEIISVLTSPLAKTGGLTASLHFSLGLAYLEEKQFAEAAAEMRHCIAKRDKPSLSPINQEIRKAGPRHCLALCLDKLGQTKVADQAFREAMQEAPQSRPVRFDYARFLAANGQPVDALNLLFALANEQPKDLAVWAFGGQVALSQPDFLEVALDWTAQAHAHAPNDATLLLQRAQALTLAGQCEAALPLWRQLPATDNPAIAAALVVCETVRDENRFHPLPQFEALVSREFLKWYKRLLEFRQRPMIEALNKRAEVLEAVLPVAGRMIAAVAAEAAAANPAAPTAQLAPTGSR